MYRRVETFLRTFQAKLEADPAAARSLVAENQEMLPFAVRYADRAVRNTENDPLGQFNYLQRIYNRFLGPLDGGNLLFLGSGEGLELVQARMCFPQSRIAAVDLNLSSEVVLTEVLSGGEFHQTDLRETSFYEVVKRVGFMPDRVVARHPYVGEHSFWGPRLTEAGRMMKETGGKLMVTTFLPRESNLVKFYLAVANLQARNFEFEGGKVSIGAEVVAHDRFITVVGN